jgi:hypothetical protein
MRVIVIVGRTREEKEETEENRLAVTAANMPLLDSNAGFPLLRLRLHTYFRNDHPTVEREERLPNKRRS